MNSPQEEIVLKGGRANTGSVVRVGDQVARPTYPQTPFVDDFLRFLVARGATFVPEPCGYDDQGRHRLGFLPGQAPMPPYPQWAFDDELLVAVATHQRRLHEFAQDYPVPPHGVWAVSAGDYFPAASLQGTDLVVCHNDLGMTNVIVDASHRFVGFVDFDYCRPVDRLFDIAVAVRHWAPFGDLDLAGETSIDRIRRFRLFVDVHALDEHERQTVVRYAIAFLDRARANIKALASAGGIGFQQLLDDGYEATNLATVSWLRENTAALAR